MRRLLCLAMVLGSCTRTGLPKRGADAGADVAAIADANRDTESRDAPLPGDVVLPGPELGGSADLPGLADGLAACVRIPVTALPEPSIASCPPSAEAATCAGGDVGAVVARSPDCSRTWGDVLRQCVTWSGPAAGEELVAIALDNCTDVIDTVDAFACDDHVELAYVSRGTCQSCDGTRSAWRAFSLPLDTRPVVATGRHIEPPCLPPVPQDAAPGTGGTTGTGGAERTDVGGSGGCAGTPISEDLAAASFRTYMLTTVPNYNPETSFGAEEISIPGLWDGLQAQLFTGTVTLAGDTRPECSFLYRACQVEPVNGSCGWFGVILSGAVRDGAFYYSWGSGSGIFRSTLGKVEPVTGTWKRTESIDYFNPSGGPPGVVVALDGNALLVYRAYVPSGRINEWQNPELMGRLADFGDRLAIVNDQGQEIPSVLP